MQSERRQMEKEVIERSDENSFFDSPSPLLSSAVAEVALPALAAPSASLSAERRLLGWAGWAADGVYMDWVIMLVEEVERLERGMEKLVFFFLLWEEASRVNFRP